MDPARYSFALDVQQQPQRARMCGKSLRQSYLKLTSAGFGDKDRRPITPPPCVKLVITDRLSGKEIDVS